MEKKYKKLYDEDLEKVNGGTYVIDENNDKCPLYGEHQWKQMEGSPMEKCDCGLFRVKVIKCTAE